MIKLKEEFKRFYMLSFAPLVFILAALIFIGLSFTSLSLITVGYVWVVALWTPGLEAYVEKKTYRFSFLKFVYHLDRSLSYLVNYDRHPLARPVMRCLSPLLFAFALSFIGTPSFKTLLVLVGAIIAEVINGLFDIPRQYQLLKDQGQLKDD